MSDLETAEEIAAHLRQEPYHLFRSDCLSKSRRFRSECRKRGIEAHLVWCVLGLAEVKSRFLGKMTIPTSMHFWGEVRGRRFETSRPSGSQGAFGIVPSEIKPIVRLRLA
jgi:hypothetical protein